MTKSAGLLLRRAINIAIGTGCALILAAGPAAVAKADVSATTASPDPAALVNVFIGTGNGGKVTGNIDTFPGAAMPFGMLSWSPTTKSRPAGGDYFYPDSSIGGFSLTHISGPGCSAAGEVPILPMVGAVGQHPDAAAERFDHIHEQATPGEYQVTLAPGTPSAIDVKLAATTRTGIGVFRFPPTHAANFLFKVSDGQTVSPSSTVRIIGNNAVAGAETSGHFCGTSRTAMLYFVAKFDRPFHAHGTWGESGPEAGQRAATGAHTGAWVSFDTSRNRTIKLKVAISYVSIADAWGNLKAEDSGWNFDAVASRAHDSWNRLLSRIAVAGGTHDQQVQFYSALYHTLLHPNVFSDANGDYIGFDDKVHQLAHGQDIQYANFSGWDIYRSEVPLLALLVPRRVNDMVTSLLNDQAQGGWLPKWGYDNDYTGVMNGDAADPIIAEAYAFGARDFDTKAALEAMVEGATQTSQPGTWSGVYIERPHLRDYLRLGYVPGNTSETLEYATADFAIARFAKYLGDSRTYRKFLAHSANWSNVFDKQAKFRGYAGYMEPRAADGTFPSGSAFQIRKHSYGQRGFEEGNTIQYTWMVPQDLHGLIEAMGGDSKATARLDILFKHLNVGPNKPYYWAGNEPSLNMPWVYDYSGAPWKTQAIVHRLIDKVYSATPGGEPGNDDLGAMSSWLVWAYLGMYPETPGAPVLVLGAPVFPRATLHLGNGHQVTILAPNASTQTYVQALEINGKTWTKDWLPTSLILGSTPGDQGSRLSFTMSHSPNKAWGAAPADRPPSYAP
ncbi:MAG TPA: GH92 family glycosyl hydrolase [Gammaproteobacteria bacterium]|nr:GH92 family glycosyl hydrolase [Gammaproteobacteria bacterium]